MKKDMTIFLSLFPNTRGLGYACIETPQTLVDYGVVTIQPVSNEKSFARAKKLIDFFQPTVILIRDNDDPVKHRSERVEVLAKMIATYAKAQNIPVYHYSRSKIREVFEINGMKSKYAISKLIIQWFPELAPRLPKYRRASMNEGYNTGVFDAISLIATHRYLTE
jgi:hypothetical protein